MTKRIWATRLAAMFILASTAATALGAAPRIAVGTPVQHTSGAAVGTVAAIDGATATVRTDRHEVRLPLSSLTPHEGRLLIAMTREQLNAEVERSLAAAQARLVPGITVVGSAGTVVGTLDAIDDRFATLKLTSGTIVKVPRSGIVPAAQGAKVGIGAEQLEAAAKAAQDS